MANSYERYMVRTKIFEDKSINIFPGALAGTLPGKHGMPAKRN